MGCCSCGTGCNCSVGSLPGPGTSNMLWMQRKKPNQNKKEEKQQNSPKKQKQKQKQKKKTCIPVSTVANWDACWFQPATSRPCQMVESEQSSWLFGRKPCMSTVFHCMQYIVYIPLSSCPLLLCIAFQEKIWTFKMSLAHFDYFFLAYWAPGSHHEPILSMTVLIPSLCLSLRGIWPIKEKSLLPGNWRSGPALTERNPSWSDESGDWVQWQHYGKTLPLLEGEAALFDMVFLVERWPNTYPAPFDFPGQGLWQQSNASTLWSGGAH